MAPQPLSKVRPGCKVVIVPPDALSLRPILAVRVAEVIGIWSAIDMELTSMLSDLMKVELLTVTAMLNAITSSDARAAAIRAAAKAALAPDDWEMLERITKATAPSRKQRHRFAHHVWAHCDELPDAILLIDPRDLAAFHAERADAFRRARNAPRITKSSIESIPKLDQSIVMVYRMADLDLEVERARHAFLLHNQFRYLLWDVWAHSPQPARDQARAELSILSLVEPSLHKK